MRIRKAARTKLQCLIPFEWPAVSRRPKSRNGSPLFLAEEPVRNDQQQDCCLIVEVHAPDRVDDQWVQQAAENAIEEQFGKALTLWSANEDEAIQYLKALPDATHGALQLATGVALFYHLARIV